MSSLGEKRPREDDRQDDISRPRKRPGGASRVSKVEAQAVEERQKQRAEEARVAAQIRGVEEVVRQHYNAVPERGREWRKTDSRIKGLRSFNNWIKSTVIHKFSPSEAGTEPHPLRVLDIGCGKGGDLQKWQQAPQPVEVYVGIDHADISIDQAKERYRQMRSRSGGSRGGRGRGGYHGRPQRVFDAEFLAEDAFTYSLGDLPIIRDIGFGPGSRWGPGGGFDVVTMMFCMHYAFENEAKAKGMLANVAGSLRKGGRFFGVIPNSDVIRDEVIKYHQKHADANAKEAKSVQPNTNGAVVHKNDRTNDQQDSQEKTTSEQANDHVDPPRDGTQADERKTTQEDVLEKLPPQESNAEWGNSIYRVRFPGDTPKDGIFRPPYGWKYSYFMEEAVEEVPEYVVPWEAFRA